MQDNIVIIKLKNKPQMNRKLLLQMQTNRSKRCKQLRVQF